MNIQQFSLSEAEFYRILDQVIPGGELAEVNGANPPRKIYLTKLNISGLAEMHDYSKDERLYQFLETPAVKNIDETKVYLENLLEQIGIEVLNRKRMGWFVHKVPDNRIIGTISLLEIDYRRRSAQWGFGLGPKYWGKGYSFEMLEILKQYAFETLQLNQLRGSARIDNKRVISLLLQVGAKQEGVARQVYRDYKGTYHDGWTYSLLAEEYFDSIENRRISAEPYDVDRQTIASWISEVLQDPDVGTNDNIDTILTWDSMNHVNIISFIQQKTKHKFTPAEIYSATSIDAIHGILTNRG